MRLETHYGGRDSASFSHWRARQLSAGAALAARHDGAASAALSSALSLCSSCRTRCSSPSSVACACSRAASSAWGRAWRQRRRSVRQQGTPNDSRALHHVRPHLQQSPQRRRVNNCGGEHDGWAQTHAVRPRRRQQTCAEQGGSTWRRHLKGRRLARAGRLHAPSRCVARDVRSAPATGRWCADAGQHRQPHVAPQSTCRDDGRQTSACESSSRRRLCGAGGARVQGARPGCR